MKTNFVQIKVIENKKFKRINLKFKRIDLKFKAKNCQYFYYLYLTF